ncbi:MAG: hypothetical protein QNJ46_28515 [Leptolyngbyaceae cyanobacterium MO_188.B28]|nr:hypothetical protein [Leptolyngbyaceae cyanobacterium MO_188.B28]
MKKSSVLTLSALLSLGLSSGIACQAETRQEEIAQAGTGVEIAQAGTDPALEGWDPVRAASIMGAMDWCISQPKASDSDRQVYRILSQGASRALDHFIETEEITGAEASLVQDRVNDQGYYMGVELTAAECTNLRNTVINWSPWQLITSREASFAVEMPSWPERYATTSTIQGRSFDWVSYETIAEPDNNPLLEDEEYYLVSYTQLPQDYLASNSEDEIFDAFGQYIFDEMGFPELENNTREASTDGVPARITSGEAYGQTAATIMYIVDDRFYLTLMVGKEPLHFERFLRSFEALDFVEDTADQS